MEATTNPNNTNTFPNILTLHIYKTILLFIPFRGKIYYFECLGFIKLHV